MKQVSMHLRDLSEYPAKVETLRTWQNGGGDGKLLLHVYSGFPDRVSVEKLIDLLKVDFPGALIVGISTGGEIFEGHVPQQGAVITGMLFESTRLRVALFRNAFGHERKVGKEIRELLDEQASHELKAAELLLPGALMNTSEMYDELSKCDRRIRMFGGYAGDHDADLSKAFVLTEEGVFEDAVLVILYSGVNFHINVSKSAGWQTLGVPMKVTKARGNLLQEINNIPAAEIYEKYLSIERDENFAENTNEFPLMAQVGEEELLRHTNQVREDGSLALAGYVMEGWDVYLTYGNPSGIISRVNTRLEEIRQFAPQGILMYSCYVRRLFWQSFVNVELEPFEKLAPCAGFCTFGEVMRNMETGSIMEYNITLLSIAMREGERPETLPEKVAADDSVLSGQASMIKRLAELVYYSNIELQKAYDQLQDMNEQLKVMAEHDSLTGLYNRGRIEELIEESMDQAEDQGGEVSLVMLDIDFFKRVNDTYGHQIGDSALVELSGIMEDMIDPTRGEAVGRWGGEEFFILLPGRDIDSAMAFAEELRERVEAHPFKEIRTLTISASALTGNGSESKQEMYIRIDDALYRAKEGGRNRVVRA